MSAPEWIATLGDRDPSVPIALAAITRAAGASDLVDFGDLVMSYREAHIACDRALHGPVHVQLTGDEVRDHLTRSVLPRLATEGWILDAPGGDWNPVRPRVPWWGQTPEARQIVYEALLEAAHRAAQRAKPVAPQASSASVLQGMDLLKSFKGRRVVDQVTVRVQQGEIVGLLGPNGAGKTTTVRVIGGLLRPTSGRVLIAGHDVTGASPDGLARAGVCVVPEGRGVFPRLTVEEHLRLVAPSRRDVPRVLEVAFGHFPRLGERRRQAAGTLSGGEQQMLALARAVAQDPPLLVVDELSMGLAPLIVAHLYEHVAALAAGGVAIVVVEQFAHDVLGVADHAVVMQHGRIIRSASPGAIADELADLYLATTPTSVPSPTPTLGGTS